MLAMIFIKFSFSCKVFESQFFLKFFRIVSFLKCIANCEMRCVNSNRVYAASWVWLDLLYAAISIFFCIIFTYSQGSFPCFRTGRFLPPGCVFVQMTLFLCQPDMEFKVDFKNVVCMVYIHSLGRYLKFYASNFPVKTFKLHFCKKALKAVFSTNQKAAFL